MNDLLIIIPTYNEKETIEILIKEIFSFMPQADILVIDDNSPDGTGNIIKDIAKSEPRVNVIIRPYKMGMGSAYKLGFRFALCKTYNYIIQMDADLSHSPRYLPRFLEAIKEADVVLGSRYISGGSVQKWSILRRLISRCGCIYARLILGISIKDITGGFRCYHRQALESINIDKIKSDGFAFQIECIYKVIKKSFYVKEIPFVFLDRERGKSKMNISIIIEAIFIVWRLKFFKNEN